MRTRAGIRARLTAVVAVATMTVGVGACSLTPNDLPRYEPV